ncbi:tryptophanyl-tRNA synthetase [Thermanaeromonas toyohensis ToBE]|uniref:Tryptophan--tRNA ligase n=1 Tax=Thermanaeromonas toyohensis ToBE TaxID=698762 RepID=A0A1W1VYW9_9FIRM|nr:tryptophan--tRNA ligase [Thermanaeromonas toyohensis]SMB98450.1 tryptophanyl-tRNA synthetase [Thermanaeromonas toyohensis ToBE]
MGRSRILSGMRPTGRLHIGHLMVLENWVKLQEEYECFYFIADWHALTTAYEETEELKANIRYMLVDWLSAGLNPNLSTIFIQSHIKEHAELHLLFSMFTPLSWLERVPTYKDQLQQLGQEGKDVSTYGFLGYPLLQAADILIYKADAVPVGEDQLPHLEFCREVARRFNYLYKTQLFPEPQALLSRVPLLPGIDGRKMSKSYRNDIPLSATPEEVRERVRLMVTDPARIHKTDPGHPEVCVVHTYHEIFNPEELEETRKSCRAGTIGCVPCKARLAEKINAYLEPVRERREKFLHNPGILEDILAQGSARARAIAQRTMDEVRAAMGIK